MTPENRENQPTSPQSQPGQTAHPSFGQAPASRPYLSNKPGPASHFDQTPTFQPGPPSRPDPAAKKAANRAFLWGGLALGLVVVAAVVALGIIPLFNHSARTEADPFAVARDVPAVIASAPVSGTIIPTSPAGAASGPTAPTAPPRGATIQVVSQVVSQGDFTKIDAIHYARGTATIGVGENGRKILRFENFTSAQGPDLQVYLATRPDGSQLEDGGLNLGALPATDGSYNIALPDDLDLTKYKAVVIWCEAFSVMFSVASLA